MKPYHVEFFIRRMPSSNLMVEVGPGGQGWPEVEEWLAQESANGYELHSISTAAGADRMVCATVVTEESPQSEDAF